MDKVNLVTSDDFQIRENKDKIIQDYIRHLVRHALSTNQNPDIYVGRASSQLEGEFSRNMVGVLRKMLLTMVQEMNDDDRWLVQCFLHTRGDCQSWRCPFCQRPRGRPMSEVVPMRDGLR